MSRAEVLNALAYTRAEEAIGPRAPAQRTGDTGAFQDAEEAGSDVDSWMVGVRGLCCGLAAQVILPCLGLCSSPLLTLSRSAGSLPCFGSEP